MLITCITAFNGLELLPKCIDNFLKFSDKVVVCYQNVSHKGESRDVASVVLPMASDRVHIDFFTPVNPNGSNAAFKKNEIAKHNQMVQVAKKLGATHFIIAAVDHFYDVSQDILDKAKQYDLTFTKIHTYYKHPTWQVTPPEDFVMPFVCKMHPNTVVAPVGNFPMRVDPAVKIKPFNDWYLFEDFYLHNYSTIAAHITDKFKSHYRNVSWDKAKQKKMLAEWDYNIEENKGLSYYHGRKIKIVPNYFDL